jgi:glycine/D-amino acid oxidase-like deaminating enzyme
MRRLRPILVLLCVSFALTSCVTYTEELNRGQRYFQANEYERALAIWRILENDIDSLSPIDRTRYTYLRGMTDYRMSLRADARHWLSLARAYEQAVPGGIEESWRERMKEALRDLDSDVYGGGGDPRGDAGTSTN